MYAHADAGGAGTILVTGRRKGVGRSTIAANLARAAAAEGPRRRFARADFDVVVIDGPLAPSPAAEDLAAAADCVVAVERKRLVPMPPFVASARPAESPGRRARVVNFAA